VTYVFMAKVLNISRLVNDGESFVGSWPDEQIVRRVVGYGKL